jgi:hypothetical protein
MLPKKKKANPEEFWILWNPACLDKPPRVVFHSEAEAREAAEVMATRFCPDTFYVMKVVAGCRVVNSEDRLGGLNGSLQSYLSVLSQRERPQSPEC